MPQKKDNLPVKVDVDLQNGGTITYANEVIATIAGVAANEIDGIAGMCVSGGFSEILGRNRNITRGVKVEVGSQEAAVDLYIVVEYGKPIQKVASEVQENVRRALESLTGLHVVRVDVHVQGVSFEKEKKAALNSIEAAKNPVLTEAQPEAVQQPAVEPPLAETPFTEENAPETPKEPETVSEPAAEEAPEAVSSQETAEEAEEKIPAAPETAEQPAEAPAASEGANEADANETEEKAEIKAEAPAVEEPKETLEPVAEEAKNKPASGKRLLGRLRC